MFVHEALEPGCIRILSIHLAEHSFKVECDLTIFDLEAEVDRKSRFDNRRFGTLTGGEEVSEWRDSPIYEALSYEWGDQTGEKQLISITNSEYLVGQNLHEALGALKAFYLDTANPPNSKPISEMVWIDAICINQNDTIERTHQVKMMGDIYECAANVYIWLGPEAETCYCKDTHDPLQSRCGEGKSDIARTITSLKSHHVLSGGDAPKDDVWQSIAELSGRSYWSRVWIIQEYLLASHTTIHCGSSYVEGVDFEDEANRIRKTHPFAKSESSKQYIEKIWQSAALELIKRRECPIKPIIRLLEASKDSSCQDLHDRIYALLGVA